VRYRSQACCALLLFGSLFISAAVLVPWAYAVEQLWGALSAAVAWGTCCVGGLLALWLVRFFPGPQSLMSRVLLGMFARTGVPLLVCAMVYIQGGRLAEAGFVYYLLAFYFVMLVVETVLLVGEGPAPVTEKPTV